MTAQGNAINQAWCDRLPLTVIGNFTAETELSESLGFLLARQSQIVVEPLHSQAPIDAIEPLCSIVDQLAPDLLVLILSNAAQAAAEILFEKLAKHRSPPIVAVPAREEPQDIYRLYQLGMSDYVAMPIRRAEALPRLHRLLLNGKSRNMPETLLKELLGLRQFVGESKALMKQIEKIPRFARCDAALLITGETGTGKEVCARAVHNLSHRADQPFVPLNCGAIPPDLVENELFGHEAGAYTSALASHAGVISQAQKGTLFLDEIDSLPLGAQVKLLRFLQDKEYRPLGARKSAKADVRIIAASNVAPDQLRNQGRMRADLYYRLNILLLHLPPLRDRTEDIAPLARHFAVLCGIKIDGKERAISPTALARLLFHDWPGNVRELENVIERAVALSTGLVLESRDIELSVDCTAEANPAGFGALKAKVVANFERNYLRTLLQQNEGNIGQAARAAQKNRRAFFELMRKHRIRVERKAAVNTGNTLSEFAVGMDKNIHTRSRV